MSCLFQDFWRENKNQFAQSFSDNLFGKNFNKASSLNSCQKN